MQINIHFTELKSNEEQPRMEQLSLLSSERLLEHFYDGDDAAFEVLATRVRPNLIGMALARMPRHLAARQERAEDLATDALMKVMQTKHRPSTRWQEEKGAVGCWLATIIRNLLISRLRTKKGKESLGTDIEARDQGGRQQRFGSQLCDHRLESEFAMRDAEELRQRVLQAIPYLPQELQEVLLMKLDGLTHREIGARIGASKSGVTRRMQAATRELQENLAAA